MLIPDVSGVLVVQSLVFCVVFCTSLFVFFSFSLANLFSVFLQFTDFYYFFGIFNFFLSELIADMIPIMGHMINLAKYLVLLLYCYFCLGGYNDICTIVILFIVFTIFISGSFMCIPGY